MSSLGKTLKSLRTLKELTLKDVEQKLGISNAYLSQLENDKVKQPSANTLYKLAKLYNVDLDILLYSAGIIDKNPVEERSEKTKFINAVQYSSDGLTKEQKDSVLEYLEFLKSRNK
ncbi:helix-turn-helix domain-containing protein [Flagellimonas amoyensis]|uniref:helix-turn-helix domain-containing protein n=1 Tax=Flagellimonas amoyensis TaxID=2169401 RepID=UPI000D380069|nr:helix-turn-helix transcriptional regulator [Allomuricauda amoyensis]